MPDPIDRLRAGSIPAVRDTGPGTRVPFTALRRARRDEPRRNTIPPVGLGWGAQIGTLPRRANLPEQYAVFNPWGAPIAGPYLSRDEAQVGLILISEEA